MKRWALFFALTAAALEAQTPAKRAFQLSDWYRVTTIRQPAMSPDGKLVAFTVTTVLEPQNKRLSEVWVVPTGGGSPTRVTPAGIESSTPRWAPDGSSLIVTSATGLQRYQANNLSAPPSTVDRWQNGSLPDDKSFVVYAATPDRARPARSTDDPYAVMGQSRPPYGSITRPADPKRFDGRQIVDFPFRSNDQGYLPVRTGPREFIAAQLFVQRNDGSPRQQLTATNYSHRSEVVSPDGKWIAFIADAKLRSDSAVAFENDSIALLPYDEKRLTADRNEQDIFVVSTECRSTAACAPRRVATLVGNESALAWSPDSRRLSFTSRAGRFTQLNLFVMDASGGTPRNLTNGWRYEPDTYFWRPDGSIVMSASIGGSTALFSIDPSSAKMTELTGGRRRMSNFSPDDAVTMFAFVCSTVTAPTELCVVDADGKNERKLTRFNDALNNEVAWSDAERFTYKSVGDREIEGWLMKPFGYSAGRRYPLVLYIHGGPHAQYNEGWFDEFQNLAAAGFMVLYTNPRGSSGYGADFTYSIRGRWGDEDYMDLMKAVDLMVARADVDSTRMGVTGGSYGGFMTGWITTKGQRFRAAQVDRADMNWRSWYGGSDQAQGLTETELYGKPWEKGNIYDAVSPIYFVQNVRTPTLIVHSEDDTRVTIGQGDEWFTSLKKQGVPVEYIRYPRSTHELSRSGEPWLLVDRLGRLRDWFSHWLKNDSRGTSSQERFAQ
jgi:dipeptidyl aminopeptidase/acylaminoacyl peptidase